MKLKDNSTQEIDTALYQLEQRLKSNIRLTDVENSNASTAEINAVDKKLTEEVKDRQSADEKLQDNINKEIADRQEADAAIENAKQDKLIAGDNIQINGNVISAISKEYTAEAPVKVTDGKISLDTVPVNKGGTGVTTQADINKAFIGNLEIGNSDVTDGTEFISSYASDNGFAEPSAINKPYKRQFIKVWNYIKDKISSVLGLTSANYGGTANKATNDGNGNNIVNTYALKSNLQYTKSINIRKVDGSSDTLYYLIAKTPSSNDPGNIDSLFVNGSDYMNRMFEGSIRTRSGTYVYNYGKNNLPIELYEQTDGTINVYWLVSDAYIRVALNITATEVITTYGGNLSPVTPTGSKMTLTEYDYKSYGVLPVARGGTGETTANAAANAFINSLTTGTDIPKDEDYYVCQWAGGNSETPVNTVYTRRPISKLWGYIKDKISSVLGLTATNYGGNSATATIADSAKNMYSKTLDLSALDKTKFYPVFCLSGTEFAEVAICSESLIGTAEYNQNRIHFDISTYGWSDTPFTLNIREYACYENNEITIGCIGRGEHNGGWAIWLRGGIHYTCFSRNADLSLKTSDYTYGDEVYTVGTNYYGGSNSNVKIEFTPQSTITQGSYSSRPITAPGIKATINFFGDLVGNVTGNVTGNVSGSSGSCTGKSAKSSFLDEYPGAGSTRLTSGNIKPKDSSEYGGMRKDVVTSSMTDSGLPGQDGHLLTMFWDNSGRWDSQFFISDDNPPVLKSRGKENGADYGPWTDIITSNNIGSQTVANAGTADYAKRLKTFASWDNPYNYDATNGVRLYVFKITMPTYFNSILVQIYDDINYAKSRKYFLGLWHVSNYGYNVSVTDLGGAKNNGLKVWLGTDGNVYLQADVYWTSRISFSYLDDINDVTITKIGTARYGSNTDINGNVLFTPLTDPITDCGALRGEPDLSSASKVTQRLKADVFTGDLVGNVTGNVTGNSETATTADKVRNALTINGQSFDGSSAVNISIQEVAYDHIVHDSNSLLEWTNCTDGSMKKVLIKSGTYNITTKGVNLSQAGTGYVLAENGAVINSHVPIAFTAPSGKTVAYNLNVVCDGAANGDNTCAFSAGNPENLILYNCSATYRTYTEIVNRNLFAGCTCYNCSYDFQNLPANSSISMKVFYQCRCYNCKCKQTIEANSSTGIIFDSDSYFYKECHCSSCDAELTTSRNIKSSTRTFACYYNCYDRCVGCLSKINVNSKALTVYSTLYGFLRCQYMSSCKETHTEGYSNIKGIVQCDFISSTSGINGNSNTHVGNSCSIQ